MQKPIRIFLVDDNSYFLQAACDFLGLYDKLDVVGTETDAKVAFEQTTQLKPDFILLDLNLGKQSGLEWIPTFKKSLPHTKIIVLTSMHEGGYRNAAMEAGADGFVNKSEMTEKLLPNILEGTEISSDH